MKQLNDGKQMKDVWSGGLTPAAEKHFGRHPTQKPVYLLERIILASTKENDVVLDPFCGSSTTGVACKRLKAQLHWHDAEGTIHKTINRKVDGMNYEP